MKCLLEAFGYLEVVSEVEPEAKLSSRPRYMNMHSELLTKTRLENPPRQAPRLLLRVFEAPEETVVNIAVPPFGRVYAQFYVIQAWGSLRFDDHRCLELALLKRTPECLSGVLTRRKMNGPDRG